MYQELEKRLEDVIKDLGRYVEKTSGKKKKEIRELILKGYVNLESLKNEKKNKESLERIKIIFGEIEKKLLELKKEERRGKFFVERKFHIINFERTGVFFCRDINILKIFPEKEWKHCFKNLDRFQWFVKKVKSNVAEGEKKKEKESYELIWGDSKDY